ncbi:hypothetical protein [Caballeronia sp. dw_19]|uniref:hypothetical protein n=1 Tax=Caballeronia sp. dw_19 TaxID=2719791 RepID=UPI001BD0D37F|nr:hypothetical protein [Caballeronia sp. dw_19]
MTFGEFMKFLALCGYPAQGSALAGGGVAGLKSPGVLAQSAVPASVTGTAVETTLASIVIPAGALKANGSLRVTTLWSYPNNANTKTAKTYFGGIAFSNKALTTSLSNQMQTIVRNRGVTNSQVSSAPTAASDYGSSGAVVQAAAIDTTQAQTLLITGTLATIADTLTLEAYTVEILNP